MLLPTSPVSNSFHSCTTCKGKSLNRGRCKYQRFKSMLHNLKHPRHLISLMTVADFQASVKLTQKQFYKFFTTLLKCRDDNNITLCISVSTLTNNKNIILVTSQNVSKNFTYYTLLVCIQFEILHSSHKYQQRGTLVHQQLIGKIALIQDWMLDLLGQALYSSLWLKLKHGT